MCGRYTITVTMDELMLRYAVEGELPHAHEPRYNISPGQMVPAVINDGHKNRLGELRWGLVPEWSKTEKIKVPTFNARAETVQEKPMFRGSYRRKRCLIPADSFYEWKKEGTDKQPMRVMLKNEGIFSMAGLYDTWTREDGMKISTCTVITTQPNEMMSGIHDRMPVILRREDEAIWLKRDIQDISKLEELLRPYAAAEMKAYPVSPLVGNVKNDKPACIQLWERPDTLI
jgi:putative SOS response-associated peptidase YedK